MRNVKTVSVCLPAELEKYLRDKAAAYHLSLSGTVSMIVADRMAREAELYRAAKDQLSSVYGMSVCKGVLPDG